MPIALPFQTAKQLAAAVRKKKIGCLELLDLYLERVEAHNPSLNAIIAMDVEGARKRAKAADKTVKAGKKLGPLHGVPMCSRVAVPLSKQKAPSIYQPRTGFHGHEAVVRL